MQILTFSLTATALWLFVDLLQASSSFSTPRSASASVRSGHQDRNQLVWPFGFELKAATRPIPGRRRMRESSAKKWWQQQLEQDQVLLKQFDRQSKKRSSLTPTTSTTTSAVPTTTSIRLNTTMATNTPTPTTTLFSSSTRKRKVIEQDEEDGRQSNHISNEPKPSAPLTTTARITASPSYSSAFTSNITSGLQSIPTELDKMAKSEQTLRLNLAPNNVKLFRCDLTQHDCGLRNDAHLVHKFQRMSISGELLPSHAKALVLVGRKSEVNGNVGSVNASAHASTQTSSGGDEKTSWARLATPYFRSNGRESACLQLKWLLAGRLLRSFQVIQQDEQVQRLWHYRPTSGHQQTLSVQRRVDLISIRFNRENARFFFTALLRPGQPGFVALLGYDFFYGPCV